MTCLVLIRTSSNAQLHIYLLGRVSLSLLVLALLLGFYWMVHGSPGISLFALTVVLGVWLILFGVMAVIRALRMRGAAPVLGRGPVTA